MPSIPDLILVTTIILTVFSPMNASFLQCWADRARGGVVGPPNGRSYCDSCGKTLGAIDLVPILSWLWNRGKSRCCNEPLHPTLLYSELLILLVSLWGVMSVSWALAVPTLLLASGLQAVLLLSGPAPKAARGFAVALAVMGLVVAGVVLDALLWAHVLAALLGLAVVYAARFQSRIAPEVFLLLIPAGALTGLFGLALTAVIALPAAIVFRAAKPLFYPASRRQPVTDADAVVFGLAAGLWLTWLYATPM